MAGQVPVHTPTSSRTYLTNDGSDDEVFTGFRLQDGNHDADLALRIKLQDELGDVSGIEGRHHG